MKRSPWVKSLPWLMVRLEKPVPTDLPPLTLRESHSSGGPPLGHSRSRPVSTQMPFARTAPLRPIAALVRVLGAGQHQGNQVQHRQATEEESWHGSDPQGGRREGEVGWGKARYLGDFQRLYTMRQQRARAGPTWLDPFSSLQVYPSHSASGGLAGSIREERVFMRIVVCSNLFPPLWMGGYETGAAEVVDECAAVVMRCWC